MKRKSLSVIAAIAVGGGLIASFQNCAKGFKPASGLSETSASSTKTPTQSNAGSLVIAATTTLLTEAPMTFQLSGVMASATPVQVTWSNTFSGTTPCTQDVNDNDQTQYGVDCTVPGNLVVTATALDTSGTSRTQTFTATVAANPNPPPVGGGKASFTIPAGTGAKPWNTAAAAIELYIGMTLTITNGDTVAHQLHVDRYDANAAMNGHPCAHEPNPMMPGQSYDCVVTKEYDPAVDPILWDHLSGTTARFYLRAYDGAALYATNCQSCHGALAASAVHGKTAAQITSNIASQPAMKIANLTGLTTVQRAAIAFALSQ